MTVPDDFIGGLWVQVTPLLRGILLIGLALGGTLMLVDYSHYGEFHDDVLHSMEISMQRYVERAKFNIKKEPEMSEEALAMWDVIQQNVSSKFRAIWNIWM